MPSCKPDIVLLVGLLAIQTFLGVCPSLQAVVGTAVIRDGVRYLPLPHPSGVSRWLNEPENVQAVARAMSIMREWVEELGNEECRSHDLHSLACSRATLLHYVPGDHHALHLVCALINLGYFGVSHEALDRAGLCYTVARPSS